MAIIDVETLMRKFGDTSPLVNGKSEVLNIIQSVDFYDFFDRKFSELGDRFVKDSIGCMFKAADEKGLMHDIFKVITDDETKQKMLRDTILRSFTFDTMANKGSNVHYFKEHILQVCDICGLDVVVDDSVLDALAYDIADTSTAYTASLLISERGRVAQDIHSAFICSYDRNGLRMSDFSECSEQVKRSILTKLDEYISFIKSLVHAIRENADELNSFNEDVDGAFDYIVENKVAGKPFSYDDNIKNMLNSVLGRVWECYEWLEGNFFGDFDYLGSPTQFIYTNYGYIASSLSGQFSRTSFVSDIDVSEIESIFAIIKFLFGGKDGNYDFTFNIDGDEFIVENFVYSGGFRYFMGTTAPHHTSYGMGLFMENMERYKRRDKAEYVKLTKDNDWRFALSGHARLDSWQ
jgi:hypothetical protein|nr:MAG TPA: hypothetical protein [Bacteriophage sp.]